MVRGGFEYKTPFEAIVGGAVTPTADVEKQARIAKSRADLRAIASGISIYAAHMGELPPNLTALTGRVRNKQGAVAGPFLAVVPSAPPGWSQYEYVAQPNGAFSVTTTGDGTRLSFP